MGNGVSIAIVAAPAIGDGAVGLVLAHNLARNGFETTFYSNPFSHLGDWLPWTTVKPVPKKEDCECELSQYDLAIVDNLSVLGPQNWKPEERPALTRKYLYVGVERVPQALRSDHRERLKATLPEWKFALIEKIAGYSGDIRFQRGIRSNSMVRSAALLCEDQWHLDDVVESAGLTPPTERCYVQGIALKRVILHPFSGMDRKNWPLKKYLALARSLKRDGWEPEFCCAASEREALTAVIGDEFRIPSCASFSEFAGRIYESAALIGNDGGPVHLASALNVPTATISLRGHLHRWRPGWRPGVVVLPPLKIKLKAFNTIIWKPFTSVRQVRRGFDTLMDLHGKAPEDSIYI